MENIVNTAMASPNFGDVISEMFSEEKLKESWVLLDATPQPHITDFNIKQMTVALRQLGADAGILKLYTNGKDEDPNVIYETIRQKQPKNIVWSGPGGWRYWNVLKLYQGTKINLWFDDPVMRIDSHQIEHQVREGAATVSFFCWDNYWSDKFITEYGIMAQNIHLAALESEYYTSTISLTDDLVFIGNLHSSHDIAVSKANLPPIFQKVATECEYYIKNDKRIASWDVIIDRVLDLWPKGDQQLFKDICEKNSTHLMNLRWFVWVLSKNEVRVRMLKKATARHPVRMFCEMKQLHHANKAEIQALVGCHDKRLIIQETSQYKSEELCQLYHYGILNLQAVDPQSMNTGIPYRVFQCAAAGKALLTDYRNQWNTAFEPDKEILFYDLEESQFNQPYTLFEDKLEWCLSNKEAIKEIGMAARRRFEKDHTWKKRIEFINKVTATP